MLPEDVEARFRRIEDNLVVTAELQRRGEARMRDEIDHVKAIQDAMARWMDKMADHQDKMAEHQQEMADRQDEFDVKMNALIDAQIRGEAETRELKAGLAEMKTGITELKAVVAELSRTVDLYLKSRTNGGGN